MHQKMMETQLTQIAQQLSHLCRPQKHLPSQMEINPKGQMNAITLRNEKQLEKQRRPQDKKDKGLLKDEGVKLVEEREDSSEKVNSKARTKKP